MALLGGNADQTTDQWQIGGERKKSSRARSGIPGRFSSYAHDDIPVPSPSSREVLIRVAAAGVNNTDVNTRTAWYSKGDQRHDDASWSGAPIHFPRIQGADVRGQIVATGDDIDPDRVGERVLVEPCIREVSGKMLERPWYFGSECDGGFAEYTVAAARHAQRVNWLLKLTRLAKLSTRKRHSSKRGTREKLCSLWAASNDAATSPSG